MEELTVQKIAQQLSLETDTVKRRIQRAGIKPVDYVGPTAIYAPEVVDQIRDTRPRGRPRKPKD
jgi:IS30 family transposase